MQMPAPEREAKKNHAETVQAETSPANTPAEGAESFEREGGKMIHLLPTITMSINFVAAAVYLFSGIFHGAFIGFVPGC